MKIHAHLNHTQLCIIFCALDNSSWAQSSFEVQVALISTNLLISHSSVFIVASRVTKLKLRRYQPTSGGGVQGNNFHTKDLTLTKASSPDALAARARYLCSIDALDLKTKLPLTHWGELFQNLWGRLCHIVILSKYSFGVVFSSFDNLPILHYELAALSLGWLMGTLPSLCNFSLWDR